MGELTAATRRVAPTLAMSPIPLMASREHLAQPPPPPPPHCFPEALPFTKHASISPPSLEPSIRPPVPPQSQQRRHLYRARRSNRPARHPAGDACPHRHHGMNPGACCHHGNTASALCSPPTLTNDDARQKPRAMPDTSTTTTISSLDIGSGAPKAGSACPAEPSPASSPKDYYSRQPSPTSCPASEITAAPKRLVEPTDDVHSSKDGDEARHQAASSRPPPPTTAEVQAAPAHKEPPTPYPYSVQHGVPDVELLTPMNDADNNDMDEDEGYFEGPPTPELMQDTTNGGMEFLGAHWTTSTRLPPFRRSNQVVGGRTRVECSPPRMRRRRRSKISMRRRPGTRPPAGQDPATLGESYGMLVPGAPSDDGLRLPCHAINMADP